MKKNIFFIFLILIFSSCAALKTSKTIIERPIDVSEKFSGDWFKVPLRFQSDDPEKPYLKHPFYDGDFQSKKNDRDVFYFVPLYEKESTVAYDLDMLSGKMYQAQVFCPLDDLSQRVSNSLTKPNFTLGLIPRSYNELNKPMQVMVFSGYKKSHQLSKRPEQYFKTRIIGSLIINYCEKIPCRNHQKKFQVLVGVDPLSEEFFNVESIADLYQLTDFDYAKSFLINHMGLHRVGSRWTLAYNVDTEMTYEDAQVYLLKNARHFNWDKTIQKREQCFSLYDNFWKEFQQYQAREGGLELFQKYFLEHQKSQGDLFSECLKTVRAANINENPERHWTFELIKAFYLLSESGFYFHCGDKAWVYNPKNSEGQFLIDQWSQLNKCKAEVFITSFDRTINGIALMANQNSFTYRYIEYDSKSAGSYQKIYSWILEDSKRSACSTSSRQNERKWEKGESTRESILDEVFPSDVHFPIFKKSEDKIVH